MNNLSDVHREPLQYWIESVITDRVISMYHLSTEIVNAGQILKQYIVDCISVDFTY